MNSYYKTEEGKVMLNLCHDHSYGLSGIKNSADLIEMEIDNIKKKQRPLIESLNNIQRYVKWIREGKEKCKTEVDKAYSRIKELNEKEKNSNK